MKNTADQTLQFALCLDNEGYPASLEVGKLYRVVPDEEARMVADCIAKSAHTGEIGDGKIFIYPVIEAIRIRTHEEGDVAIS